MPKVSYLVTCSTETDTLESLLKRIVAALGDDQLIILQDKTSKSEATDEIIQIYFDDNRVGWYDHALDNNYGAHKNFGIEKCKGDFIFQIDGDELPPEALLGENLHALLDSNPTIEAYAVPRLNDFKGVTEEHAKQWGWKLTYNPRPTPTDISMGPFVNWPDYQWRIFKRDFPRIGFTRKLHEKIEGYLAYTILPAEDDYALYHDKTIEKQIATNLSYNKRFTEAENRGHSVFR